MHRLHRLRLLALSCLSLLWAAAPSLAQDAGLNIGSKRFTESYILAEVMAQTAAPHLPAPPQLRQGLGNTAIVYEALRAGSIDLYAEWTDDDGSPLLSRLTWSDITQDAAHWESARSKDGGRTWQTHWVIDIRRRTPAPTPR